MVNCERLLHQLVGGIRRSLTEQGSKDEEQLKNSNRIVMHVYVHIRMIRVRCSGIIRIDAYKIGP